MTKQFVLVFAVVVPLVAACFGGKDAPQQPHKLDGPAQLSASVLELADLGGAGTTLVDKTSTAVLTNEALTTQSYDPETARKLVESGRSGGFARNYATPQFPTTANALWFILTGVHEFSDGAAAMRALDAIKATSANQDAKFGLLKDARVESFQPQGLKAASIGNATTGVVSGMSATFTRVEFVSANVIGYVVVVRLSASSDEALATDLSKKAAGRIEQVAESRGPTTPIARLAPRDLVALSEQIMTKQTSVHVSLNQRIKVKGNEEATRLVFDAVPPNSALGSIELSGEPTIDVYTQEAAAYFREPNDDWQCLSDVTDAKLSRIGFAPPNFVRFFDALHEAKNLEDVSRNAVGPYTVKLTVPQNRFPDLMPDLLGPDSYLRVVYPAIGAGESSVELVIDRYDYRLQALFLELRLPVANDLVVLRKELELSGYGQQYMMPEARSLPLCAVQDDPPCTGKRIESCLTPARELRTPLIQDDSCSGTGRRVCIVPLGAVSQPMLNSTISTLKTKTGLDIRVAPAMSLSATSINPTRGQMSEQTALALLEAGYQNLYRDQNVVLIALTPFDMYTTSNASLRFIFGTRFGSGEDRRAGVVSTFRMDPQSFGAKADAPLVESRLRKMLMKYAVSMYFKAPDSSDPASILYNGLNGLTELDAVRDEMPPGLRPLPPPVAMR